MENRLGWHVKIHDLRAWYLLRDRRQQLNRESRPRLIDLWWLTLSLNFEAFPVFSSLPPGDLED